MAVDGGVRGRKLKMKMTENDFDQMTGILHCKSGKAFQNNLRITNFALKNYFLVFKKVGYSEKKRSFELISERISRKIRFL